MPITLDSIRQQYPQYANVDDQTLAAGLHAKFYPQLDFNDFAQRINYPIRRVAAPDAGSLPAAPIVPGTRGSDPSQLQPDITAGPRALVGAGEMALGGITGGVKSLAEIATGADPGAYGGGYQPRTQMGKDITGAVGKLASTAGNAVLDRIAPPTDAGYESALHHTLAERFPQLVGAIGTVVPAIGLVRGLAGAAARSAVGESAGEAPAAGLPNPAVAAQQAGFKFRPSDIQASNPTAESLPGSTRETITASPQQTAALQRSNVALATRLGGEEIGLQDATKILPEHIEAASRAPGAVYDATGQAIGTLDNVHPSTLTNLRAVAADQTPQGGVTALMRAQLDRMIEGLQSGQYQGPQLIKDISYLRKQSGDGGVYAADALESEMENQLKGQPQTLADFQAARTQFAKIHDVQDSLRRGLIDPQALLARSALRRDTGRPLSGNLDLIANAANEGPGVVRMPSPTADQSPVAGSLTKTIANAAGNAISRVPGMDIGTPGVQARLAAAAPSPGPLPNPAGLSRTAAPAPPVMGAPPGAVGVAPRQLGLELAPGAPPAPPFDLQAPPGDVIEPAQRTMPVPQGRPLNPIGAVAGSMDDAAAGSSVNSDRRLNLTKQILRQIQLRNGQLPGTLENGQ